LRARPPADTYDILFNSSNMSGSGNPNQKDNPLLPASATQPRNRRPALFFVLAVAGLLTICFIAFRSAKQPAQNHTEAAAPAPATFESRTSPPHSTIPRHDFPQATPVLQTSKAESAVPTTPRTPQQLVAEILEISSTEDPITADKAEKYKRDLEELIKLGAASVPAIRELLDKKVEYDFADVTGGDQMGYASLRASLIDALKQIGGPEADEAMVQVLQTSALPSELLEIAKNLDQDAPGQYHDQILNAARESLAIGATNQVANVELGPAFRILQNYGGANTIADAAKNEPANFNNAINLVNMPDGQGLPALVQMAQNSGSSASGQTIATEMIAQMAGQNPQAVDALVQMAQNGQISNGTWEKLAPILAGDQLQLPGSTATTSGTPSQNSGFTVVNTATTSDQISQRIALIDKFLTAIPGDSAAAASLRNQRNLLSGKLGQ